MKDFFEKRMMWVALIFVIEMIWDSYWIAQSSMDLNRTIGWGWDVTNLLWWYGVGNFVALLPLMNVYGYFVLLILKRRTNFILSILHTFILIGSLFINSGQAYWIYIAVSFVVLVLNVVFSREVDR